ncbi:NAD-dependent epimerase/dehydratase family protein [Telmatospirillum siberiense]|uniref:Capsular biosynthesis protein n=1 Tax=Telmatospirillum siberiense TaxID=382514 RepID=A0A2N3PVK6_9PROT|nr:NAD(P)-dependent oxidoreductase [Telmatospirillum siberiense]PKU24434.1 capsular biosynthesis protein [Telmatospirillum siberiense]
MSRSILVLGAGGFIGRHVTACLAASDWARPIATGRHLPAGRTEKGTSLRLDITDEAALERILAGVDGVVNCMAGPPPAVQCGYETLFRAAEKAGRPVIVHLSSMAVYGNATGLIGEDAGLDDGQGPYAVAKLAGERLAADYRRSIVLRPGCVYGPGGEQWSGRIARLLKARRIGDLGAGGDGIANLVHVEDVARAVLAALQNERAEGRAFNLAMTGAPTWNDYFLQFAKALGAVPIARISERRIAFETRFIAAPLKIAEIASHRLGLAADRLPPPIPPSLARLWRQEIRLDSSRAEETLAMRWKPLAEGLAETAAWYG